MKYLVVTLVTLLAACGEVTPAPDPGAAGAAGALASSGSAGAPGMAGGSGGNGAAGAPCPGTVALEWTVGRAPVAPPGRPVDYHAGAACAAGPYTFASLEVREGADLLATIRCLDQHADLTLAPGRHVLRLRLVAEGAAAPDFPQVQWRDLNWWPGDGVGWAVDVPACGRAGLAVGFVAASE